MSRTVSLTFRTAMEAQETGLVPIVLLIVTHANLAQPIRLSSDPTQRLTTDPLVYGTLHQGNNYLFLPFAAILPDDKEDAPTTARLVISNVDRSLIPLLRTEFVPPAVTIRLISSAALDDVEIEYQPLDIASFTATADFIEIALAEDALMHEPYPWGEVTPSHFPGLFGVTR